MKIQIPIYESRSKKSEKTQEKDVLFPLCIKNSRLSNKDKLHLIYLSEKRQITAYINIGNFDRIEITTFEIKEKHDLGAIYQANGFDDKDNKSIEADYFKRLLEMEKSKITELISLI